MNKQLRQFERESKLEIFGLGARREIWEAALEKYAELIVDQMLDITNAHTEVFQTDRDKALIEHIKQSVKQHFGVEE